MKITVKGVAEHLNQIASNQQAGAQVTSEIFDETDYDTDALQVTFNPAEIKVNPQEEDKRKSCALKSFKELLAPGEQIETYRFGVTQKPHDKLPAGCPVLKAITNKAEYFVVYDEFVLSNGLFRNNTLKYGNYKPKGIARKSGIVVFLAAEFGKALAKKGAEELYNKFFGEDKDAVLRNELNKMKDEIVEILRHTKYENLEDKLIQTRGWLRDTYTHKIKAYKNKQTINTEELRADLKSRQEELQGIAEIIKQRTTTNDLENCDYLGRVKVTLFAACAALRVILFKEQIFWQNIMRAEGNKNYANDADSDELKEYVATVSGILKNYVEKLKQGRMGKISDFSYSTHKYFKQTKIGGHYKHWAHIQWADTFESKSQGDPFKGDKIRSFHTINTDEKDNNVEQVKANVQKEHTDHVTAVKGLFSQYVEDPINEIINNLDADNLKIG